MASLKILPLVLLIAVLLGSCDSAGTSSEGPGSTIEEVYQSGSELQFEQYLVKWNSLSVPVSTSELANLSDTVKYIYEIFDDFYSPFNLNRYAKDGSRGPEVGNDFYAGLKNIIVQNKLTITFNNSYETRKEITGFRPPVFFENIRHLYLFDDYKAGLDTFLNEKKSDIQQRYNFLNTKLQIVPGHWFGWHYITHPEVFSIDFNNSMDSATVNFRIRFEGGAAVYKRTSNKWEMISSRLTWIE